MRTKEEIIKYFREQAIPEGWREDFIARLEGDSSEMISKGTTLQDWVEKHYPSRVSDIVLDNFPKIQSRSTEEHIHNPLLEKWRVQNQRYLDWLQGYEDMSKWIYRLESTKPNLGLWYNARGQWCLGDGLGSIPGCKTKDLPMGYDWRYKQAGRDWFSGCSRLEDLRHWYSRKDAEKLLEKGFVFTRYLATEYYEYPQETVFIKHTSLAREVLDINNVLPIPEPTEIQEKTYYNMLERCKKEGKHRYRRNSYGSWCTVCGYYGGIWIGSEECDPEKPDLICHGEPGWTMRIKG